MSIHIIVDGYNLIRQSKTLNKLDRQDLQRGREALLETLATYKKLKHHRITVVYDGANAPRFSPRKDRVKGIEIRFSNQGQTADSVIKKMALKEREKALVVSSDSEVVGTAASLGAATISSQAFEEKIMLAAVLDPEFTHRENESGWIPTTKKKGPRRRLSKKARRRRIKINKL